MRRAERLPAYCSTCWQPPSVKPGMTFVDFEAAYDGPVIPGTSSNISIDDMIICQDCAEACARMVGFEDGAELRGKITEQRKEIEELEKQIRAQDKMIVNQNDTIAAVIDFPPNKTGGKSRIVGPKERKGELDEVKARRHRSERAKAVAAK